MKTGHTTMRKLRSAVMKLPLMLTCREFEDFVLDYFEGTLPTKQHVIFDIHLMVCHDCRSYLAAYQRSVALSKAVFERLEDPVPGDVPEDLVEAIIAAKDERYRRT